MSGFYVMPRGWQDDPAFGGKREAFSKRDAWVWLVENASQEGDVYFSHELIFLNRGQQLVTTRRLAQAWGWHPSRVARWLKRLESCHKITLKASGNATLISILDFWKWRAHP